MKKVTICDPPSGWKYGFPKAIPEGLEGESFYNWLDSCGYPKNVRESFGDTFFCRFWEQEVDDSE